MMRDANGLQYFLTDHLGSTVAVTNASGTLTSQQRYLPFGEVRTNVTTPNSQFTVTDLGYTGQRALDPGMGGLMDYNARFYSPMLGRFIQPDTITPGGPQGLNRYSYVNNNPIKFNDPTGHKACGDGYDDDCDPNPINLPAPIPDPDNNDEEDDDGTSSLGDLFGGSQGPTSNLPTNNPNDCVGLECLYNVHQDDGEITLPYVPPLGWVDSVLANEWTPLITDLIQLGAAIGLAVIFIGVGAAAIGPGLALLAVGLGVASLVAMVTNLASLDYQADHELYGVTRDQFKAAAISNLLTPVFGGVIPESIIWKSGKELPKAAEYIFELFLPTYSVIKK